jgi:2-desacetyl-2-hydroxyethyl bacteriochlorophyllide A dehydrogenase
VASERRVVFPAPNVVELEAYDPGSPGDGEVEIRTICSLISTGTEGIVLRRLFSPDTGWAEFAQLPFRPGYAAIGVIERVGSGVSELVPGRVVAVRRGHGSRHVVPEDECYPIPDGVAADDAVWFALAGIAFRGAYAARIALGDSVLVVGAGPIGQMLLRWAVFAGAGRVIVVDPMKERLSFALHGGAAAVIDRGIEEAVGELGGKDATPGIIVDTTGNAAVFRALLRVAPQYGRIVLLGDTGRPEDQRLTQDVVLKGLTIVGAHDGHHRDGWTGRHVSDLFFDLVAAGRFPVQGLITHRFAPDDAWQAYDLTGSHRERTMGVLLDWSAMAVAASS